MRIALVAAAGALAGLLGGTGWGALQTRDALVAAHAAAAPGAGSETAGAPVVSLPPEEDANAEESGEQVAGGLLQVPGATDSGPASVQEGNSAGSGAGAQEPEAAEAAPRQEFNPEGVRRLGKILGAMKPPEAAKVLLELEDAEAVAVLVNMNDRLAAPILASLPAERAALLSRLVLAGRGGER